MAKHNNPIIIIGAGMSGMLAALLIKKKCPDADIRIIERSAYAGGHYRTLSPQGFGLCDNAMRLIYETGISEVDDIIHHLLPEDAWHRMPDNHKDIAGIYWNNVLQEHSAYIDMRGLPSDIHAQSVSEVTAMLTGDRRVHATNAKDYLTARFGPTAGRCYSRVLEKLYHVPASKLDIAATHQPAMDRIILYDERKMDAVLNNDKARAVIAWPDQLTLPVKRHPPQAALYPKSFGMHHVIDAMCAQLEAHNIQLCLNQQITKVDIEHKRITSIMLDDGQIFDDPSLVISANGLHAAASLLNIDLSDIAKPPPCWLVFLRVKQPPAMGKLYHFYCYDESYATFRVTHYANYCPDAHNDLGYPICIELWANERDEKRAIARAINELKQMQIIDHQFDITAQAAVPSHNMHALCRLDDMNKIRDVRDQIIKRDIHNLITTGPLIEDGIMLLYEVWRDMHRKISGFL